MKSGLIATLITASFAASCAVHVQVKKDAKNSNLSSAKSSNANLAGAQDFLKQLDGLRTTAADLIIKEMAQNDYVGAFRSSVRKYRGFMIANAGKPVVITDSFYTDASKQCRSSGLSLNADDHNEMLGMILKTVVLAKLSETDVGKINAGLAKEMQAVVQFITMELGVDIVGTSEVTDVGGIKTTKGNVKIKLKPIDGELIDAATKKSDDVEVLSLNFERALGSDMIGTFAATIDLTYEKDGQPSEAAGIVTVSRVKEAENHIHNVMMSMGIKGETPSYTREIIVKDNSKDSMKYDFTDVLNAGTDKESRFDSVIDLKAGTQCKGKSVVSDEKTPETVKESDDKGSKDDSDKDHGNKPTQSPTQTPVQGKTGPSQMK
jgi:hypothetical protein